MTKKITKATFKSFLKKNEGNLFIKELCKFDGMIEGTRECQDQTFIKMVKTELSHENTCGYKGVWVIGGDSFSAYSNGQFEGIKVYNCCGSFIVAKKI